MREAAGVYLDGLRLTFRGEVSTVTPAVAEALNALIDALQFREPVPDRIQFGRYTLDLTTGWLCDDKGEQAHFTASCARIIARLMATPGATVTRAKLGGCLYGDLDDRPDDAVISVYVYLIREVLRMHDISLRIETVRGFGMRLVTTKEPAL